MTLVAYSISRIVTEKTDEQSDRLLFYGEPTPESIGSLRGFLDDGGAFQKMILMTTEEHLKEVRPSAVAALGDRAALTTALPGMLEVGILVLPRQSVILQCRHTGRCAIWSMVPFNWN